jgi:S1-C subfamily serine protease
MKTGQLFVFCTSALILLGCVSPSQMLVGPQGNTVRCAANGFGFIGAPLAEHSVTNCVSDYKNAGFLSSEDAGNVGIQFSDASPGAPSVSIVMPNSPAGVAGLRIGDQIIEVNGQPVLDRAAARTMMFGKVGDTVTLTVKRGATEITYKLVRAGYLATRS